MLDYSTYSTPCSNAKEKKWKCLPEMWRTKQEEWRTRQPRFSRTRDEPAWEIRYWESHPEERARWRGQSRAYIERARKAQNQRDCRARAKVRPLASKNNGSGAAGLAEVEAVLAQIGCKPIPEIDIRAIFNAEQAMFFAWLAYDTPRTRQLRSQATNILKARIFHLVARHARNWREPTHSEFAAVLSAKVAATSRNASRRRLEFLRELELPGGPWANSLGRNPWGCFEN